MYIFSRRAIQRSINQLDRVFQPGQIDDLVRRLNRAGSHRLAATWEAVLLDGLTRAGALSHEAPLEGGTKPDITFRYPGENVTGFIADITTISDEGLNNKNPAMEFSLALSRLAQEVGLNPDHLHYTIGGVTRGDYGHQKTTLLLPSKKDISSFLHSRVCPFLKLIRDARLNKHELSIKEGSIDILFSYDSSRMYGGGSYPSYEVPRSPKNNPLWNKLRGKVSQFETAPPEVPTGIIVCDGGCYLLQSRTRSHDSFTSADVVRTFLAEFPALAFVLLVTIDVVEDTLRKKNYIISGEIFTSTGELATMRIRKTLSTVLASLPKPTNDPINAYHRSREVAYDLGHLGGHMTNGKSVRMSSREIQEILAGRRTVRQINELHNWRELAGTENQQINPFDRSLSEGRLITGVRVDQDKNEDDDWITFEFGPPDPAISPFVAPRQRKIGS